MYEIIARDGRAKSAVLHTPHGVIETPVFMNVATAAAIKGGLDAADLRAAGCEVALCNTYHLHLRPGEGVVRDMGGLRKFMAWDGPILTDSGGFQVFSLGTSLRRATQDSAAMPPERSVALPREARGLGGEPFRRAKHD
ncbi:MAG: tRNA-guanine transglycosylase, partial [Defluviitaleaceae bacterium]|nr:tRNA-guanine transglycosylase [Defluviitaleaceae bacterium]